MSTLLTVGANADMAVAGILVTVVLYLVGMAFFRHDIKFAITAVPLAMVSVGLMISVSIIKAARK